MGGVWRKAGEANRIYSLAEGGMNMSAIGKEIGRSSGFVKKILSEKKIEPVAAAPVSEPSQPDDRKALVTMIINMDMPKVQKLKVLEAIL